MDGKQTVGAALVRAIGNASVFNPAIQTAPACVLWPDRDRQWEAVVPRLQNELRELLVLGDYAPDRRTGPAIWLRCVIARRCEEVELPENTIPILYLPGVSRQDLRAVEDCPEPLKPLAELQYRGVIWSQINAKDWTILAFLKSDQGGLGLDVAQDKDAKNAMQLALPQLLDEEVRLLRGKRLDKVFFNTLLTGGDPVRDLLHWLDQGDAYRAARSDSEWKAFVEVCKSNLAFDPAGEGVLAGAARLAAGVGPWQVVWERFCEAPGRYPNVPAQIRKCKPPTDTIFWHMSDSNYGGWPQWNASQEDRLRQELKALQSLASHDARKKVLELEKHHGGRRDLVWAELREAPLAVALEPLDTLARVTGQALAAGGADDLAAMYRSDGWRADDAVLRALAAVERPEDLEPVAVAIRALYQPWLEEAARYLQRVADRDGYPGGTVASTPPAQDGDGECVLFVDGLRFDIAKRLADRLHAGGAQVGEVVVWAALPSVTATGKPAVTGVRDKIEGLDATVDFEPSVKGTGQSLKGGQPLRKLLAAAGWTVLDRDETGDGRGKAWSEIGDIDHEGHDRGWKLAKTVDGMVAEIRDRVSQLLAAGWERVRVVTDHGWLLLPGGLPKIDLPHALTENKWGRCAVIKPGAATKERLFPWYWNSSQHVALADGIACFRKGLEYAHGGLSLQECLNLELTVTARSRGGATRSVAITDIAWKGLRCTVALEGEYAGLSVDVRTQAGNPETSEVVSVKALKDNGTASVVVENEDLAGTNATIVVLDSDGELVAQASTVIGGGHP